MRLLVLPTAILLLGQSSAIAEVGRGTESAGAAYAVAEALPVAPVPEPLPHLDHRLRAPVHRPDRETDEGLSQIDLAVVRRNVPASDPLPAPAAENVPGRNVDVLVTWAPPMQRHLPVYFEDVAAERYGQSIGPLAQPVVSTGRFLVHAALLPYQMGVDSPQRLQYDVGYARPGSPTPAVRERLPFSMRGLVYQGAATTGVLFFVHP